MRSILRTFRLLSSIGREIGLGVVFGFVAVSVIGLVAPLLLAVGLRPLVDGVASGRPGEVWFGAAMTAIALAFAVLAPTGYRWATIRLRERSHMVVQRRLLDLSSSAPGIEHFERPEFWDRFQLLKRNSEDLASGFPLLFIGVIVVADVVVTVVMLAGLQPVLALLPLIALPALWLGRRADRLRERADLSAAADRRSAQDLFTLSADPRPGKEIRVYGLGDELLRRHVESSRKVHQGMENALFTGVLVNAGGWLLFAIAYVAAVLVVIRETIAGRATTGDVAMTLALTTAIIGAVGRLTELAGSMSRIRAVSEHYHWLEGQTDLQGRKASQREVPRTLRQGVVFDRVFFSYGKTYPMLASGKVQPAVLSDISLDVPAGAVVAVVGENGAGKTTLVKLLAGMYQPSKGRILVDGADLASIDLDVYRTKLSAGFQDFMRYELTVREAIGVGDISSLDAPEDPEGADSPLRAAVRKAGAGFAYRLPNGLDTQLGTSWEGGVDLSGGEWQKLAMARSMMRPDPLLVILDEPTASLDPHTEHALFEQLAADAAAGRADGRITMLISHRFSTVRMADLIIVLEDGRVTEQGTHQQLLAHNGLYAELFQLQADAYR